MLGSFLNATSRLIHGELTINDLEAILHDLECGKYDFRNAPYFIRSNPEIVKAAIEFDSDNWNFVADKLKYDPHITEEYEAKKFRETSCDPASSECVVPISQIGNKEYILNAFTNVRSIIFVCSKVFKFISPELKGDKEVVMAAIACNCPIVLQYAPLEIRRDREVICSAMEKDNGSFRYASFSLRKNKEIAISAVSNLSRNYIYVSPGLQVDEDIVLAAVKRSFIEHNDNLVLSSNLDSDKLMSVVQKYGRLIRYIPVKLLSKELCLAAVKENGLALQYVPFKLRDKDAVIAAHESNPCSLRYVPKTFYSKELCELAVKKNGRCLKWVKKDWIHREMVLTAVSSHGEAFQHCPKEFHNDREIILAAVKNNGSILHWVEKVFKRDKEIVLEAVRNDAQAFPSALYRDNDIVLAAIHSNFSLSWIYGQEPFCTDQKIVLAALAHRPSDIEYVTPHLLDDRDFVASTLQHGSYSKASENVRKDPDIALEAITKDASVFHKVPVDTPNYQEIALIAYENGQDILVHATTLRNNYNFAKTLILEYDYDGCWFPEDLVGRIRGATKKSARK